jgi:hypothetical protein
VKLSFESFELELQVAERSQSSESYEDWCRLKVRVIVPGFIGNFDWSATVGDLRQLDSLLSQMHEAVGIETSLSYDPLEPSVAFIFRTDAAGHVEAQYSLESRLGWGPKLTGTFSFDQSYIPSMREHLRELIAVAAV